MTKSERFTPVTKLAESKERDAARGLKEAQDILYERETRLSELLGYLSEYRQRLQHAGSRGIDAGQMHDYQAFIVKLEAAIAHQRRLVDVATQELDKTKRQWIATRHTFMALGKVVEGYRQEERRRVDLNEQDESDERSQRQQPRQDNDGSED